MAAIKDMSLSWNTVTQQWRMAVHLEEQLKKNTDACHCFSLQFNESTDMVDATQLCVFLRMIFGDMSAKEELLTILPLNRHNRDENIFHTFMECVNKTRLHLLKFTIAPAMVGCTSGFIAVCKRIESFPAFLNYHCIIHKQACGEILDMKEVMWMLWYSVQARIVQRRLFSAHLENTGIEHTDLLLSTDVRCLSRSKFLVTYSELLPELKDFLKLSKLAKYA